ncbi:MAG TPA: dual specificity protein phosphatase family protein [Hyphomicrobiaceae bacterium]|nr:dual specificity protein phosphatase family protein [Hyphomicrobiaceae bacterium]
MRLRSVAHWSGWLLLTLGAAVAGYCGYAVLSGNFAVVVAGELYRSAQPTAKQIESYHRQYGVRTIVNLRGANRADWYREEVAAARAVGIVHIDFAMSAKRRFSVGQANALLMVLRSAPKPILIHCRSGADRSGLVAALYLAGVDGADEAVAERQLSLRFGHLGLPVFRAYAMDESWHTMESWLGSSRS